MYVCVHSTTDVLGSGQFGVVFKGEWVIPARAEVEGGGKLDVAVKKLKDGAKEEDRVKFLQEAAIIGQFSHPNVVKLHGIVIGEQVRAHHVIHAITSRLLLFKLIVINWCREQCSHVQVTHTMSCIYKMNLCSTITQYLGSMLCFRPQHNYNVCISHVI